MAFKHIVHPTDFSDVANSALYAAVTIARKTKDAIIHLVHVYEQPYANIAANGGMVAIVDEEADADQRSRLRQGMEHMAKRSAYAGIHFTSRLLHDVPVHRFYEHLGELKPDLIVMGSYGHHGPLYDAIVGSNTRRIIRYAPAPVLAVPGIAQLDDVTKIVWPPIFRYRWNCTCQH